LFWFRIAFRPWTVILGFRIALGLWTKFRFRTMWITFGLRTMWITFGLGFMMFRLRFVVPWMQDFVPVFQILKSWKMFVIGLFFACYCNYICKFK
jgi:hypothetical protein